MSQVQHILHVTHTGRCLNCQVSVRLRHIHPDRSHRYLCSAHFKDSKQYLAKISSTKSLSSTGPSWAELERSIRGWTFSCHNFISPDLQQGRSQQLILSAELAAEAVATAQPWRMDRNDCNSSRHLGAVKYRQCCSQMAVLQDICCLWHWQSLEKQTTTISYNSLARKALIILTNCHGKLLWLQIWQL